MVQEDAPQELIEKEASEEVKIAQDPAPTENVEQETVQQEPAK